MSRINPPHERELSLTEELEKLEQSITLSLQGRPLSGELMFFSQLTCQFQEIDHNFNRCHRIVTGTILPIVEQYAEHSRAVWEGSKFWKHFFEASANVSLSGYEEQAVSEQEETLDEITQTEDYDTSQSQQDVTTETAGDEEQTGDFDFDQSMGSLSITESTPRAQDQSRRSTGHTFAKYPSPYEAIKREITQPKAQDPAGDDDSSALPTIPSTPGRKLLDESMTPASSPFRPRDPTQTGKAFQTDILLHRVLDKNYRLQATPLNTARKRGSPGKKAPLWQEPDSPMSSPLQAPKLRSEIYGARPATRTPGKGSNPLMTTPDKRAAAERKQDDEDEIGWGSDSDEYDGPNMSPPKTITFALPQSRVLQTPAREASRRIVEDLLRTAGGSISEDMEDSPSIVVRNPRLDDTF
ncbi:MAG: DASH complex subunit ask1 [Trizodia sp. TS-e1964]|nr:MAG: DASH complex subunit ask1 [Trizodia sp. TS-e1964]